LNPQPTRGYGERRKLLSGVCLDNVWTFYAQFCAILVKSCFSAFWKAAVTVRDNNTKNIKKYNGGWYSFVAWLHFNWVIKCNRPRVASDKIFAKVRGRLYNANMCLT